MSDAWDLERPATRRAILFADLVESVRLYERFEARTIDNWRRFAALARDRVAPSHGGRLVRTVGDSLLMEFETAASATAAAFDLHQSLTQFNAPDAGEAAMWLRVGVHVAKVVAEEHELWGNGVNLAARLASLAQPGQTVASAEVHGGLSDGVQARVEDLGLRYMKHVSEPVRVFLLHAPGQAAAPCASSSADLRPAVAVVPFVAMPADAANDALGHAMADDIIASLSRHPGLRVLSRASTAAVRGVALDLSRLRELLGASFLLSGHFYVHGSRIRLAAELCELQGGEVLWAGGVSGDVGALFEGQDDLVPHLVAQVSQQVMAHELSRVRSLPMDSLASYSLLLGAQGLLNSLVSSEFDRSREALQHLSERHPRQAAPHAMLTQWHVFRVLQGWTEDAQTEVALARQHAELALDKDRTSSGAWVADGTARVFAERDFEGAATAFTEALRIDPQCSTAWARLSECQTEAGEHQRSLQSVLRAIEISPLDPQRFVYECYAARTCFVMGDFMQAAEWARASVRRNTMHAVPHRLLVASLWQAGQADSARSAATNFLRLMPRARATDGLSAKSRTPTITPFMRALHAAGVPL